MPFRAPRGGGGGLETSEAPPPKIALDSLPEFAAQNGSALFSTVTRGRIHKTLEALSWVGTVAGQSGKGLHPCGAWTLRGSRPQFVRSRASRCEGLIAYVSTMGTVTLGLVSLDMGGSSDTNPTHEGTDSPGSLPFPLTESNGGTHWRIRKQSVSPPATPSFP